MPAVRKPERCSSGYSSAQFLTSARDRTRADAMGSKYLNFCMFCSLGVCRADNGASLKGVSSLAQFGRTLIVDPVASPFLRQAGKELQPRCAHYEVARNLDDMKGRLGGGVSFDLVVLDHRPVLLGAVRAGELGCLPPWKNKLDEAGRLKLVAQIKEAWPESRVVLMMDYPLEIPFPEATLGADGCVNKNWRWGTIIERLAHICAGEIPAKEDTP